MMTLPAVETVRPDLTFYAQVGVQAQGTAATRSNNSCLYGEIELANMDEFKLGYCLLLFEGIGKR
ncbi:hypothetical protein E2C01_041763 [Portunus trituberculatus]|uniref:Uncharacterized protein n=1 Tax=Portunus trituberculatus TaxID=210409 RepID=A0A5B7FRV5_PORTR|nr:hypothetical protein [Portunus trituberculatus]